MLRQVKSRNDSPTKMNVLIAVPWDQKFGGVPSVVGNLAGYLRERSHGVVFLHPSHENIVQRGSTTWGFDGYKMRLRVPIVGGHAVRSLVSFFIFFPVTLLQMMYLIKAHRINVINVHYPTDDFFYFAICSALLGTKLVTSVHGADFFPAGKPRNSFSLGMKFLLSSSDCIVAPSRAFMKDFVNLFPAHGHKCCFIHNGISASEMRGPDHSREKDDANSYILCIAAHNEKKGIDVLLRAFAKMKPQAQSMRLFLVGDGPLRSRHEELARSLGIRDQVDFLGELGRPDVVKLLHGCELFVLPSRSEPFGIVVTEAMACKKPIVATAVGGIAEIIENGLSGILVEPDNPDSLSTAICSILEDNTFKTLLASNGYARVCENFLWDHTGAKYETLFSKLLNAPNLN